MKNFDLKLIEDSVRNILIALGEDPDREGLVETPKRVAKMYDEVFEGMKYSNDEIAEMFSKCFVEDYDGMIIEKKSCLYKCQEDDKYKYLYNGNCIKQCPSGTDEENFVCKVDSNICTFAEKDINLIDNSLDVVETQVKIYLSEFNSTKNHIPQYNHENYTIIIYINASCIKDLALEMH